MAETHVHVRAVPGPGMIQLRHEGDGMSALPRHLLEAMLEEDVPVRRLERTGVVNVYLVLARRRFTLAELHRDACRAHLVAKTPVERLCLGGLKQMVVLVVPP